MPLAAFIPLISSGLVSDLTKITFLPCSAAFSASLALNTTYPEATPGEAGSPFPITFWSLLTSRTGCNKLSKVFGSILNIPSSFVIVPSFTISTIMRIAASAVRLPDLVCKIHNLPSCTVNSISCMSL